MFGLQIPRDHGKDVAKNARGYHADEPGDDEAVIDDEFTDASRARAVKLYSRQIAWIGRQNVVSIARRSKGYDDAGLHTHAQSQRHESRQSRCL